MGYHLSDRGRTALGNLYRHIGQLNGTGNVHKLFSVDPTAEQRLEDMQREQVGFLDRINVESVRDLIGEVIGLYTEDFIARRTSSAQLPRRPRYVGGMQDRKYQLYETEFDTNLPWAKIDAWSKFKDFPARYAAHVAISIALSRISIGWHGTHAAAHSNPETSPNGEDMNIGWLQKLRIEKPSHVMGRALVNDQAVGDDQPIHIHANADYKNVDALAYDLIAGMPSWARNSTEHVVVVSQDLVDEKYFPMINRPLSGTIDGGKATSDEVTYDVIMSRKQIGGRPAAIVPKFPDGTMFITPLKNLSIYWQEGSRRRFIRDEPENKVALADYNSINEGYVIEDTDFAVLAENITFTDPNAPAE
ncbi:phage major capsid protein, P2 family [Altericroceibacterium endophyticum]|uniref:Phage major capsid protein, P2 family n=1 Tax=Altericroceibacterium endophyticum TaxID=1808508 RepID=A0A6I4T1M2_9SPHN|nr:phage major capsid protein, P2 family [Altericroceibacterium endophyticum]MXO64836.1 phage major capsid protein, P2 family [Altericroceibacterium endophyticum]